MTDIVTKRCRDCGGIKPLGDFYRRDDAPDGHRSDCRDCVRSRARRHYEAHREPAAQQKRKYQEDRRSQVFAHYGDSCACCGTTENLSIDHIDSDGQRHREELFGASQGRASSGFYHWLVTQGFPQGYQVLCRPCNASKRKGPRCRLNHVGVS